MEDNFDFDGFTEDDDTNFEAKLEEYRERMMLEAIEQNYKQIEANGLSEWHLRKMDNSEIMDLQKTLNIMIKHFEVEEEFEKCIVIKKELDKILNIVSLDI